ncbi:hypothetical protein [Tianweitania sediminis]|uniref:Uncharacterized protein n=1 Tax=Tianweitania sediminis TaxID=1502156 RepID=A0A8J7R2T6_9HYPH|nr:hypothetical protein [Tianweitania sediminis]MBP0439411.1 hypothetical protein [Tianweitania sediminis]
MAQFAQSNRLGRYVFIQSILFFTLGLLIAGLIAVLIAPAFWNRAVRLTRRRLEATLPMSLNEIQAEKDRVRAEYAMAVRRVEIEAGSERAKANERAVEISRLNEQIRLQQIAAEEAAQTIAMRDTSIEGLESRLREAESAIAAKEAELKAQQDLLEQGQQAYEDLTRLQEETSLISANRQIDLLARDSDIDRLNNTVAQLRAQRADAEQKLREQMTAALKASEDLKSERRRTEDLERKNERLMSELSDRDERLERREKALQALQGKHEAADESDAASVSTLEGIALLEQERDALRKELGDLQQRLAESGQAPASVKSGTAVGGSLLGVEETGRLRNDLRQAERREEALRLELTEAQALAMRLEAEIADLSERTSEPSAAVANQSEGALVARYQADRDRLEARLQALSAENDRLQKLIDQPREASAPASSEPSLLRDELAEMAAQMVHLTRVLEGPGSPIDAALAKRQLSLSSTGKLTLADRIRALKAAASPGEATEPVQSDR